MRLPALAASVAAVLAVAGCSASASVSIGDKTVDNEKLEKDLKAQLGGAVACPDGQKGDVGHKFTCVLTVGGQKRTVFVTIKPKDRFHAVVAVSARRIDAELAPRLAKQFGVDPSQVSVACPQGLEPWKGRKFTCALTMRGTQRKVVITLTDPLGNSYHYLVPKGQ